MGDRLSRITARELTRMGVELHLGAMVTGMDDDGVEITKPDGNDASGSLPPPGSGRPAPAPRRWARVWPSEPGAELDKAGGSGSQPDCSVPGHPEMFVVGDLMALDDLPGVAEVAMQSGAHAAHTIGRRLDGQGPKRPSTTATSGTLAVISRFTAVAKIGPVQVGGFIGWLLWLVVHVTFLTGFKNRFGALARWGVSFVGHGRYERALIGRWVADGERPSETA